MSWRLVQPGHGLPLNPGGMLTECSPPSRGTGRVWQLGGSISTMDSCYLAALSQLMKTMLQEKPAGLKEPVLGGGIYIEYNLNIYNFHRPPPPTSMGQDPATPLIQAIRSELKRFQRSQNSGVTIVNEPDIMDRESKA